MKKFFIIDKMLEDHEIEKLGYFDQDFHENSDYSFETFEQAERNLYETIHPAFIDNYEVREINF